MGSVRPMDAASASAGGVGWAGACPRVTGVALENTGDDRGVAIPADASRGHRSPDRYSRRIYAQSSTVITLQSKGAHFSTAELPARFLTGTDQLAHRATPPTRSFVDGNLTKPKCLAKDIRSGLDHTRCH